METEGQLSTKLLDPLCLSIIRRGAGYYSASLLRLPVPVLVPVSIGVYRPLGCCCLCSQSLPVTWVSVTAYVFRSGQSPQVAWVPQVPALVQ